MRIATLAVAGAVFALPAIATATQYSAQLTTARSENLIARDMLWSCTGAVCRGSSDYSRPLVVCQSLARKAGRIAAFRVDGRVLADSELERCNSAAKAGPATADGTH